jgi:hypothetical protein
LFMQFQSLNKCPHCKALVLRYDGCKFMTCRCGSSYCDLCAKPLTRDEHWSHFFGAPFGDKCLGKYPSASQ